MCIVVLFILYTMSDFDDTKNRSVDLVGGPQSEVHKRDCATELVYSVTDSQCGEVCEPPAYFVSRNGACVNVLAVSTQEDAAKACDPRRGVLAYLLGDPQFGKSALRCLSVDPGIQPDDPHGKNIICTHGSVYIDYLVAFPSVAACHCTKDPTRNALVSVANTRVMREYGVCVGQNMLPLFRHDGLVPDTS